MHFALLLPTMPHAQDNTQAAYDTVLSMQGAVAPTAQRGFGAFWAHVMTYVRTTKAI
jgi:hypothetical protein